MSATATPHTASISQMHPDEVELLIQEARHDPAGLAVLFHQVRAVRALLYNGPPDDEPWYHLSKLCQHYIELAEKGGVQGRFNDYTLNSYWRK